MTPSPLLPAAAAGAFSKGFGAVLEIAPAEGAPVFIDGRGEMCVVLSQNPIDEPPHCVWRAGSDTLARIFEGGRALDGAYLSGRLKISGDMSVMARLVLESST